RFLANCRTCGVELRSFTFGSNSDQCESCRNAQGAVSSTPTPTSGGDIAVQVTRPDWQNATALLIAINVAVFVLMVLKNPNALAKPTTEQLIRWGADFGPLTLDHQPWRLITSAFLHIGIIHIAVNMWSLWVLGRLAERFVGATSFIVSYFLTGIGASLA